MYGQPQGETGKGIFRVTFDFADDDARELSELGKLLEITGFWVDPMSRVATALAAHREAIRVYERDALSRAMKSSDLASPSEENQSVGATTSKQGAPTP